MEEKVKILFISGSNLNVGSHRIWVHDLCSYFKEIGVFAKIGSTSDIDDFDCIIYGKGIHPSRIRNKIVGCINPVGWQKYNCDFIITGSIEEKVSLSINKNVFLFPLIENLFQNSPDKIHVDKEVLTICFHGHYTHLASFNPYLKAALEEFSKAQDIELSIILGEHFSPNFSWNHGKPDVKTVFKQWSLKTIASTIQDCDIGVCPNAIEPFVRPHKMEFDKGLFDTDYTLRFKNKSNAGRSFVFHQLGIPTIADLTPSHFHILSNPDNGYLAMSKDSWLQSFHALSDSNHRNFIAKNARKEFDRLYNPLDWARRLYDQILNI